MKYILFFLATSIATVITVPLQFPDSQPRQREFTEGRALSKPNANYNRLIQNRIIVQQNDDDFGDYDDTVVQPDNIGTTPATNSNNQVVNDQYDLDDEEDEILSDGSRRRRRKPFCIPFQVPAQYNNGFYRDANGGASKTFGGINVLNQHYNLNGGYPNYGGYGDQQEDYNKPSNDVQNAPIHNQHSGYGCIPIYYGNHHGINRPHHRPPGSHFGNRPGGGFGNRPGGGFGNRPGGGFGGFGNRPGYGGFGGNRPGGIFNGFNGGNRPQGGPFGFFGPGGLFDLSNIFSGNNGGAGGGSFGNGDTTFNRPISSVQNNRPSVTIPPATSTNSQEIFSDSVSDDDNIKPVIEINVPDTIQDLTNNIRPVVGGIANQVSGFFQQLATRPDQTIRRINREFNSYLQPIYGYF